MLKRFSPMILACVFSSSAAPKLYEDFANQYAVSADKLYALALAESGMTNEYGHTIPYPWSVKVNGHYYRFKNKQNLFIYLKKQMYNQSNQCITYGVAGRVLTLMPESSLWNSLSVTDNLHYLASSLQNVTCNNLSQCTKHYHLAQQRNQYQVQPYVAQPKIHKIRVKAKKPKSATSHRISKIVAQVSRIRGVDPALIHAVIAPFCATHVLIAAFCSCCIRMNFAVASIYH